MNTYTIELKAKTMNGNVVDSNFRLFVGSITLTVNLRRSDGSDYTGNTSVSLCHPYSGICATEYHNNSSGNVVFTNLMPGQYKMRNSGGVEKIFGLQDHSNSKSIKLTIE
mmetsp:Transcript_12549/g.18832  ORF Transcript_12549/g.18832 Transcript_12549/m.18832 type:complete len:110 (-) Transcript_12549:138-467(-)